MKNRAQIDVFRNFYVACEKSFSFLVTEGYTPRREDAIGYETSVVYSKAGKEIRVNYEFGVSPWVVLRERSGNRWVQTPLLHVIKNQLPELVAKAPKKDDENSFESILDYYAQAVKAIEK